MLIKTWIYTLVPDTKVTLCCAGGPKHLSPSPTPHPSQSPECLTLNSNKNFRFFEISNVFPLLIDSQVESVLTATQSHEVES